MDIHTKFLLSDCLVVDTLSNSDARSLCYGYIFIYYILRVIYVIDIYSIPRIFCPRRGQSRRFNLYANFALGGLWYHCAALEVSVSYKGSLSNLLHYAPFALFLIIPWILGSSCLFSIFSLFWYFFDFISMGSIDMDDGVFCDKAMRNAVYKARIDVLLCSADTKY